MDGKGVTERTNSLEGAMRKIIFQPFIDSGWLLISSEGNGEWRFLRKKWCERWAMGESAVETWINEKLLIGVTGQGWNFQSETPACAATKWIISRAFFWAAPVAVLSKMHQTFWAVCAEAARRSAKIRKAFSSYSE